MVANGEGKVTATVPVNIAPAAVCILSNWNSATPFMFFRFLKIGSEGATE
jgi:hypothetical protein